ncbi:MAG: FtsQ-type POTRA domain-containing protein [Candidatus Magasanikbacteria bacterium]|nr:FtsQ-type POTRA domain-containing protein [Candidatus Magasanikbacteria bacterium]
MNRSQKQQQRNQSFLKQDHKNTELLIEGSKIIASKTFFELVIFCALIVFLGTTILKNQYFKINDISIDGLDTFASEQVKKSVSETLNKKIFSTRNDSYLTFRTSQLESEIRTRVSLDTISITKRFPHTIFIHATERPVVLSVHATNGTAIIARDGKIVRWTDRPDQLSVVLPNVYVPWSINETKLETNILNQDIVNELMSTVARSHELVGHQLKDIHFEGEDTDLADIAFNDGLVIKTKITSDIETQMKKAKITVIKFPLARQIDVRFSDKAFVTF